MRSMWGKRRTEPIRDFEGLGGPGSTILRRRPTLLNFAKPVDASAYPSQTPAFLRDLVAFLMILAMGAVLVAWLTLRFQ